MVKLSPSLPARLALVVEGRLLSAVPVSLTGQEACVRLEAQPHLERVSGPLRLFVDWDLGGTTELRTSLAGVEADGRTAHLAVHGVGGDWRTFLAWLGTDPSR